MALSGLNNTTTSLRIFHKLNRVSNFKKYFHISKKNMKILTLTLVVNFILILPNGETFNSERVQQFGRYSDQLHFRNSGGYQPEMQQLLKVQRAINARFKGQRLITQKVAPMIFFDEDDNEPFAPEPKFEIRMGGRPKTSRPTIIMTPAPITMTSTTTMPTVPRWPPMIEGSNLTKMITPPKTKVTFFPSTSTEKSSSSIPSSEGRDHKKNGNNVTPPPPVKPPKPSSKITPTKKPIITTTPKISSVVNKEIEKVSENSEQIFLEGSFYVPFMIKAQEKNTEIHFRDN